MKKSRTFSMKCGREIAVIIDRLQIIPCDKHDTLEDLKARGFKNSQDPAEEIPVDDPISPAEKEAPAEIWLTSSEALHVLRLLTVEYSPGYLEGIGLNPMLARIQDALNDQ